jgi:hypothetical protein
MHSLFAGPTTLVYVHTVDISNTDNEGVWVYVQRHLRAIHIPVTRTVVTGN